MSNPVDTLRKPARRAAWILSGVAGLAIAATAVVVGPSIAANLNPAPTPSPTAADYVATLTPAEQDTVQQQADAQQATIVADQAAAAAQAAADRAAALVVAHQVQSADGPVKCDAGYTANAVDAAGNESNCQKNGPGGQPCVAYNDQNQCTAYYKP
ncbi:MAG: hypothetical protein ABIP33_06505 [Pseudolysinimonas sp.]